MARDAAAVREGPVQVPQGPSPAPAAAAASAAARRFARLGRGRDEGGRRQAGSDLHGRLYRSCAAGDAGRRRGVGRRQADRLDRDATAVRRPRRAGAGARTAGGRRPRHRARHGFGLRRQAHRRGGGGGGAAGEGRRQAGQGGVDAEGGIHLGLLPAGRRHRREGRRQEGRHAHGLGVPQLQLRRRRPWRRPTTWPTGAPRSTRPIRRSSRGRTAAWRRRPTPSSANRTWTIWPTRLAWTRWPSA